MNKVIILLLLLVNSTTTTAQSENQPKHKVHLGFPGTLILIPIDTAQTAYYICRNPWGIDLHIIPNDSLSTMISHWQKADYSNEPIYKKIAYRKDIYIKPHSNATKQVITEVTSTVRFNLIKSFTIAKITDEEEQHVTDKL